MNLSFKENDAHFKEFNDYFVKNIEGNLEKLFVCKFNGWLSRGDYTRYVENATKLEVKAINEMRLNFFLSFFGSCLLFDSNSNRFLEPENKEEFKKLCFAGLDNNEEFLIVDYINWVAINTSYDFTDICYFSKKSNLAAIKAIAKKYGLHTFKSD